ncbi:polysaccharide deacetylase family protein [Candidatus Gracilibacteria bacterium]|nr:polysaccharide deacetylase family protein [Candidatus Gracilibacteria bacterium]
MNFQKYRITIFILIISVTIISSLGIYVSSNLGGVFNIGSSILNFIGDQGAQKNTPTSIEKYPIDIKNIISKRYLYTLEKIVEQNYKQISGLSIDLTSGYEVFSRTFIQGDSFLFEIENLSITIPTSEFYFDIWNSKKDIVSSEISNTLEPILYSRKLIALTFDDGPSPKYTNYLLEILKSENVKATFFVLGSTASAYPEIIKREKKEGHEIGSHGFSHSAFTKLSTTDMNEELYKTDQAIYNAIGEYPTLFRPPYGATSTGVMETIQMPAILWSIDSRDWKTHSKIRNIHSVDHAVDGDIIIMHDIHKESVESIPDIIKNLKSRGFEFVTISELLGINGENTQIGKKCIKKGSCK